MNVATVVASMPAFTAFFRVYIWDSRVLRSLRMRMGGSDTAEDPDKIAARKLRLDPNQPRTGRDEHRGQMRRVYHELDDSWLMNTQSTAGA